jgi:hypothetical protein
MKILLVEVELFHAEGRTKKEREGERERETTNQ